MPTFHRLQLAARTELTSDSVALHLAVPQELHHLYRFREGQFLTLEAQIGGERMRRPYSICTAVQDYEASGMLRVGIRRLAGGRFSSWAKAELRAGDRIAVMTPDGRFTPPPLADAHAHRDGDEGAVSPPVRGRHHLAFAGGSGITPIMSILATRLRAEPQARFTLIYGNRHSQSVMFLEELEDLKNAYLQRLHLVHILSDERTEVDLHHGMLDQAKCSTLLAQLVDPRTIDVAYICGPEAMMLAAEEALRHAGVHRQRILVERFTAAAPASPASASILVGAARTAATPWPAGGGMPDASRGSDVTQEPDGSGATPQAPAGKPGGASTVWITIDGKERSITLHAEGTSILQAGLQAGMPLPYACQAGVCCTCRALVTQGEVRMDRNFSLEESECAQGFVLTCQAHPLSEQVSLSYDER